MKTRFILLLFLLPILLSGCLGGVKGDGNIISEERELGTFTSVAVSGVFHIVLREGTQEEVLIETDANIMDLVRCEIRGKKLVIDTKSGAISPTKLAVFLTYRQLQSLELSGAVKIGSKGTISGSSLEIDISGAADLDLELDVKNLELEVSGGSQMILAGVAERMDIDLSGASELDGSNLQAIDVDIDISGAGNASLRVSESLNVEISGAANVSYIGNPMVSKSISGAGSFQRIEGL